MDKKQFIEELRASLSGLPQNDIEERIGFYSEMIDDRVEDGMSEEEAIRQIGTVKDVTEQIVSEMPLSKLVKEKVRPKRRLQPWEIVLLALGSPIWLSLGISAAAVWFSLFASLGAVVVSFWAVAFSLAVGGISGVLAMIVFSVQGYVWTGLFFMGGGFILSGISVFVFFGCKALTRLFLVLTKKSIRAIKIMFVGRRREA